MAPGWKARRRWALVILVLGVPAYIVVATTVVGWFGRPPVWAELLIYVALGIVWVLPLRRIFRGVARPDPAQERE